MGDMRAMGAMGMHGAEASTATDRDARAPLIDLSMVDLSRVVADRAAISKLNPHRHEMALLDAVVWLADDRSAGVGLHRCGVDEHGAEAFWIRGHFPGRATMPGVLMVEVGAQLACYLWNSRQPVPRVAAFLRIEDAVFRRAVVPGETLVVLCRETKRGARRFISDVQGLVDDQLAFSARVSGIAMEEHRA